MEESPNPKPVAGVPQQILKKYFAQLAEVGIAPSIIKRLQEVIEAGSPSETALKKAMLPDESTS